MIQHPLLSNKQESGWRNGTSAAVNVFGSFTASVMVSRRLPHGLPGVSVAVLVRPRSSFSGTRAETTSSRCLARSSNNVS